MGGVGEGGEGSPAGTEGRGATGRGRRPGLYESRVPESLNQTPVSVDSVASRAPCLSSRAGAALRTVERYGREERSNAGGGRDRERQRQRQRQRHGREEPEPADANKCDKRVNEKDTDARGGRKLAVGGHRHEATGGGAAGAVRLCRLAPAGPRIRAVDDAKAATFAVSAGHGHVVRHRDTCGRAAEAEPLRCKKEAGGYAELAFCLCLRTAVRRITTMPANRAQFVSSGRRIRPVGPTTGRSRAAYYPSLR